MGVMSSYNDWDGVPVSASYYFLTELLREEYGFDGYVVSDSEAVELWSPSIMWRIPMMRLCFRFWKPA